MRDGKPLKRPPPASLPSSQCTTGTALWKAALEAADVASLDLKMTVGGPAHGQQRQDNLPAPSEQKRSFRP